jgi:hypothetical protein
MHQPGEPRVLVPIPHWIVFLRFERSSIGQCFGFHPFIGGGIQGIHRIPSDGFAVGGLGAVEEVEQVIKVEFAFQQAIEDRAEFPTEGLFFTQCHGGFDMTGHGKRIEQFENGVGALHDTLVYCIAELLDLHGLGRLCFYQQFHFLLRRYFPLPQL